MSDFHIGKDKKEQKKLLGLAEWIKREKLEIECLVFTGDMIDAPSVQDKCIQRIKKEYLSSEAIKNIKKVKDQDELKKILESAGKECVDAYNKILLEVTVDEMGKAGNLFAQFIESIGVDSQNVVLCCGNHDRIRFIGDDSFNCRKEKEPVDDKKSFEAYDKLCGIINKRLSHTTTEYSCGNINFVIANSNWKLPEHGETNKMCVDCKHLCETLRGLKHSGDLNICNNIFIAHKPYDDFCENSKYYHSPDGSQNVYELTAQVVTAFLYGDKHAALEKSNNQPKEFMCGMPLCEDGVHYNLLDFQAGRGIVSVSHLVGEGEGWKKVPISKCIEQVYKASCDYLKDFSISLLEWSEERDFIKNQWDDMLKLVRDAFQSKRFQLLSDLFNSFCELRQGASTIAIEESLFKTIEEKIKNSKKVHALGIKGRPGAGKSTFLTLEYLYMLYNLSTGRSSYVPFYFSVNEIDKDQKFFDTEKYITFCAEQFNVFLSRCCEIRNEYKLPVCIFVDGLEKSKILSPADYTLEKRIYMKLESSLSKEDKYVMSFNTQDMYKFDDTFEKINDFSYVLFTNSIRVLSYKDKETKFESFITAYLKLKGNSVDSSLIEETKQKLARIHKPTIDLFLLHFCDKQILGVTAGMETWEALKLHLDGLKMIEDDLFNTRDDIREAAGMLYAERKRYSAIANEKKENQITVEEFLLLVNTPVIMDYLVAKYFVHELIKYSEIADEIPFDSILNSFLPNELAILVRLILDDDNSAENTLFRFIDKHICEKKISSYLHSTIAYLCGHLRTGDAQRLMEKLPKPIKETDADLFSLCYRRSYMLANVVCDSKNGYGQGKAEDIILELVDNVEYRKFNRSYQLHYYQDASLTGEQTQAKWSINRLPIDGFDFRRSFLMLYSKLNLGTSDDAKKYPLLEFDLFTLCDLVYSRVQHVTTKGFFYDGKYNTKDDSEAEAVLKRTIQVLNRHNSQYGFNKCTNKRIAAYFSLMQDRLQTVLSKVVAAKGKSISISHSAACSVFQEIQTLEKLKRVGWEINTSGTVKPLPTKEIEKETAPVWQESLMQHIMEAVYIAQIFLPEHLPVEGYQKAKVISLLLFSEIGRIKTGDYSPNYSALNKLKKQEREKLFQMLLLGSMDGYAVQSIFFEPINERPTTDADINIRICWEIKVIQREYRYYTLYNELEFSEERRAEFEDDFEEPDTEICREIRKHLIKDNPAYINVMKNRETP